MSLETELAKRYCGKGDDGIWHVWGPTSSTAKCSDSLYWRVVKKSYLPQDVGELPFQLQDVCNKCLKEIGLAVNYKENEMKKKLTKQWVTLGKGNAIHRTDGKRSYYSGNVKAYCGMTPASWLVWDGTNRDPYGIPYRFCGNCCATEKWMNERCTYKYEKPNPIQKVVQEPKECEENKEALEVEKFKTPMKIRLCVDLEWDTGNPEDWLSQYGAENAAEMILLEKCKFARDPHGYLKDWLDLAHDIFIESIELADEKLTRSV